MISEFDFFAISANMKKKTQENRFDKLENTLALLKKKVLLVFRFTAQLENPKKIELFCIFWWFKKAEFWGFCVI